jgi:opacity protein-like surface antigen
MVTALAAGLSGGLVGLAPGIAWADRSPLDVNVISEYGESETPRSAAMGGALRALGSGSAGIFLNPAAMATARLYHIEALTQYTPETRRWVLGGTIVDSITSKLAGAFSIQGIPLPMDPDGIRRTSLDLRLGLAYPITDRFILGINGRYLKVNQSGTAPSSYGFGSSLVSGGLFDPTSGSPPTGRTALVNTATVDVGLVVKPADTFYIAAVGQNLTYANNGFLPLLVGGGLGYGNDTLAVEVDGLADVSSWGVPGAAKPTARLMAGAEYKVAGIVPLRLGYRFDQGAKLNTLSFGSGYVGSEFAVEVSVKRTISNPGATTVFLGIAYYLESSGLTKPTTPGTGLDTAP